MASYKFWEYHIPEHMMPGIERYVEKRIKPGDFLLAIFSNNFVDAVSRADDDCAINLKAFMGYMYNEMPSASWGSPEKVKTWLKGSSENLSEL